MKIMFVLGSMGKGGAERVIANLSNSFIKKHDISIVVTSSDKPMYELDSNIHYFSLDESLSGKNNNLFSRTLKRIISLRKIIKSLNPDVIVSLLPEPTFRLMIAKIMLRKKTIISVRNDPNREYNSFLKKLLVKLLYTRANGFVFQTEDAKKWFSKSIQKKSVVIPNPINEDFIGEPYVGKRDKCIVNVGRLSKQKNQELLINAFSMVSKSYPDYILKIYGDGPLKETLLKQIDSLGLNDRVLLMGEVKDIKNEIKKASLFVLSSDYEGMPNALMEAMALGLPCISTDCPIGGPRFLISNTENGILFDVGNDKNLANSIDFLLSNPDVAKKIGISANKICETLNPNEINKKWENYILEIINE